MAHGVVTVINKEYFFTKTRTMIANHNLLTHEHIFRLNCFHGIHGGPYCGSDWQLTIHHARSSVRRCTFNAEIVFIFFSVLASMLICVLSLFCLSVFVRLCMVYFCVSLCTSDRISDPLVLLSLILSK